MYCEELFNTTSCQLASLERSNYVDAVPLNTSLQVSEEGCTVKGSSSAPSPSLVATGVLALLNAVI